MARDEDIEPETPPGRLWKRLALAALVLAAAGGAVAALSSHDDKPKRPVTTVMRVVLPPPPPPPPVRKEEKPPEPQKTNEPPKMTDPAPTHQPAKAAPKAPPGAPLTAMAGAGTNAYGLAAGDGSGNTIGGGGGGGGNQFGAYAGQIQTQILEALQRDDKTRSGRYLLTLRLWIGASGQVERAQLVSSSGDDATDQSIIRVITASSIGQRPPQDMPQPVTLRIRARTS